MATCAYLCNHGDGLAMNTQQKSVSKVEQQKPYNSDRDRSHFIRGEW